MSADLPKTCILQTGDTGSPQQPSGKNGGMAADYRVNNHRPGLWSPDVKTPHGYRNGFFVRQPIEYDK
jgi:hypothetical protein